ncbi:Metallo-hydrolase/oxidoreductase [Aspergillus heteromorphus CBS 117.55]|uniref:Metallo-hydrolase/oxidoreductase n=1 Tax=Aspergillus heteromorphus CBS 117.55 TaxID=1448321 RepID=A0A317W6N0_9EURO|nr:Metallo-hydrolase/oxidoreductase [Aspergillus heteromorphus CBS 117.55]PWY80658.1 Metallo-hydrolase/oxidoreductase [Aspergillus heteromorphus CBS 117.55]
MPDPQPQPQIQIQIHHRCSSPTGLSSVTTLLTTPTSSLLIDPPFLLSDAHATLAWLRTLTTPLSPLKAIFITHHHPDHFFSANPILAAFPAAKFYAAPYVRARIDAEYAQKVPYWAKVLGQENIPAAPQRPAPYPFSFFLLGEEQEPVFLLGPVVGDCVDQTVFWIPGVRAVVAGDVVFGRSVHVWLEETETPALLSSWHSTLNLIASLNPVHIIPGHMEAGWELDAEADLAHTRRYLDLFAEKVFPGASGNGNANENSNENGNVNRNDNNNVPTKPPVRELYEFFERAFPECRENKDFFLGHLANQFGEGGKVWEENRHPEVVSGRTVEGLSGFLLG